MREAKSSPRVPSRLCDSREAALHLIGRFANGAKPRRDSRATFAEQLDTLPAQDHKHLLTTFMKLSRITLAAVSLFLVSPRSGAEEEKLDQTYVRLAGELGKSAEKLKAKPDSADAAFTAALHMSELAAYLARRGQRGDLEKALSYFNGSLDLREQVAKLLPFEPRVVRGVLVGLNDLAEFLARRNLPGDLARAVGLVEKSIALATQLCTALPDSLEAQRDLAVSLDKMGTLLALRATENDLAKARDHFSRSAEIAERIHKAKPDDAGAKRDLALALERLGAFLAERIGPTEMEQALALLRQSLELRQELFKQTPDDATTTRELSIGLEKLGDLLVLNGNAGEPEKTLALFAQSALLREELMKKYPTSAQVARDLSVGLNKLADFLTALDRPGDAEQAKAHFTRDLEISEKLLKANPESLEAVRDVAISRYKLAGFAQKRGETADEEKHIKACYELLAPHIAKGAKFDASIMDFFAVLKERFAAK